MYPLLDGEEISRIMLLQWTMHAHSSEKVWQTTAAKWNPDRHKSHSVYFWANWCLKSRRNKIILWKVTIV